MLACDGFGNEEISANVANIYTSFILLSYNMFVCANFGHEEFITNVLITQTTLKLCI